MYISIRLYICPWLFWFMVEFFILLAKAHFVLV